MALLQSGERDVLQLLRDVDLYGAELPRRSLERARERADRRGERCAAVGASRGHHPGGEGRRVETVLRGADPVGVDRLDVPWIGLTAPPQEEFLRRGLATGDGLVRNDVRLPVGDARRARDDRPHLGRRASEVLTRLLVRDLVELPELPLAREARRLGLEV